MEEGFKALTLGLATAAEASAAVVIGVGVVEAGAQTAWLVLRSLARGASSPQHIKEQVRLKLGRWLALALEFELAADILRTAVAPTWNEIGQLAAVVVLRTTLNYFLQMEIDRAEAGRSE